MDAQVRRRGQRPVPVGQQDGQASSAAMAPESMAGGAHCRENDA